MSIESIPYYWGLKFRNSYKVKPDLSLLLQRYHNGAGFTVCIGINMNSLHSKTCCQSYIPFKDLSAVQQLPYQEIGI